MQAQTDFTNLDPQVVQLARAIRTTETNTRYDASNKDADGWSVGAYQWHGANEAAARQHFQSAAKQFGLDPNDFSPVNQDKAAYAQMKAWKDSGYHAGEIASMWNTGSRDVNSTAAQKYLAKIQKALGGASTTQAAGINLPQNQGSIQQPNVPGVNLPQSQTGEINTSPDQQPNQPQTAHLYDTQPKPSLGAGAKQMLTDLTIGGEKGTGESIAAGIIPHLAAFKEAQASEDAAQAYGPKLLQAIRKAKAQGKDTSKLEHAYELATGQTYKAPITDNGTGTAAQFNYLNPAAKKSNTQALLEVGKVGLDMLAGASGAGKGMETGVLAQRPAAEITTPYIAQLAAKSGEVDMLPKVMTAAKTVAKLGGSASSTAVKAAVAYELFKNSGLLGKLLETMIKGGE